MKNKKHYYDVSLSLLFSNQYKCALYRIYLNIFAIFLGFKIVPLGFTSKYFEFWYKGDNILWLWPWYKKEQSSRFISLLASGNGEFGDATFSSLKEIDKFWEEYYEASNNNSNI